MKQPDMTEVPPHQEAIHHRLSTNWRSYCHGGRHVEVCPYLRDYRPGDHWNPPEPKQTADLIDGAKLNKAVVSLPELHRKALQWWYIQPSSPGKAAKGLKMTQILLKGLVISGRQRLIDEGV